MQQVVHQAEVGLIAIEAAPQQLAKGAQGRQRIAQLMHQQAQLVLPAGEFPAQLLLIHIQPQRFGEAAGGGFEARFQDGGPGQLVRIHPQGPQQ